MYDYDVIFIGSGHSCNHGAGTLAAAGKKVALVEQDKMGGTCTNYGCDAKIILDGPFEFKEGLDRYNDLCVAGETKINWNPLVKYKRSLLEPFDASIRQIFRAMGMDILEGHGVLKDAHTVEVNGKNYTAEYIVIGAGIISMEFASMAMILGKQVTIVEFADRAPNMYPKKYVDKLVEKMSARGVKFIFSDTVAKIEKTADGFLATTKNGVKIPCDYILEATGRAPNVEKMGLEEVGIEFNRRGIVVDEYLRTSVKNIFASGDIIDKTIPKLTPTAEYESNYIADHLLGLRPEPISYPPIPNLVFTLPRIGQVGISVDEATANPDKYNVVNVPYGLQQEWVNNRETDIEVTFIMDKEGYLVGAAVYGSEAGTWLDFFTLIINQKLRQADFRKMIFAFPTQTYAILMALTPVLSDKPAPSLFDALSQ